MSDNQFQNNKRVAKNTILLYFRLLFSLGVSLYTSRLVLRELGVEDFGIYNVVGGVVVLFTFLNNALTTSTQRFITYNLGKNNPVNLHKIFSSAVIVHFVMAIAIVLLSELIGSYFLYEQLVIPTNRISIAFIVFHLSVLTTFVNIISVPYTAIVVAHEKMDFYAGVSIFESILKLTSVLALTFIDGDKLLIYASLYATVPLIIRIIYGVYCNIHFEETQLYFPKDSTVYKDMTSFAGWSLIGNMSIIGYTQGLNMLLNMFFGPAVNAARGISVQIQNAIYSFVVNFQTAINPQITKNYAAGEKQNMYKLIALSSRVSFYLLLILCTPLIININYILSLWLTVVPVYTNIFCCIILCNCLIEGISNPFMVGAAATGNIKYYHIIVGSVMLAIVPISYFFLRIGCESYVVFIVQFVISCIAFAIRLYFARRVYNFEILNFIKTDFVKMTFVAVLIVLSSIIVYKINVYDFAGFLLSVSISIILSSIIIFYIGFNKKEKNHISKFFLKHKKNCK